LPALAMTELSRIAGPEQKLIFFILIWIYNKDIYLCTPKTNGGCSQTKLIVLTEKLSFYLFPLIFNVFKVTLRIFENKLGTLIKKILPLHPV
jgi:hypothetical protein